MFSFFSFACCGKSPVEMRNFIENDNRFTGSWECSGNASFYENEFYLNHFCPKLNGGIYKTEYLPENFSLEINLSFEGATEDNPANAGIWITKEFHLSPIVFGGPLAFVGAGLMMVYDGKTLNTEFRKNDGRGRFTSYQYFPQSFINVENNNIRIRIESRGFQSNITAFTGDRAEKMFLESTIFNFHKYYLSITTKNGKYPHALHVSSAFVSSDPSYDFSNEENKQEKVIPKPKQNSTEILIQKQSIARVPNAGDVLDQLLEFQNVADVLTKVNDVRKMLSTEILPFSDRWQRRSIRINRKTLKLRNNTLTALKEINAKYKLIYEDILQDLDVLNESLGDISNDLFYGINGNLELNNEIREAKNGGIHNITEILVYLAIFEVCVFIMVFIIKYLVDSRKNN